MKAITPANEIPPAQSTAASGDVPDRADEREHGHERADEHVLDQLQRPAVSVRKSELKNDMRQQRDEAGDQEAGPISFQSICQSPRKLCATSDQAWSERAGEPPAEWCWCPASGRLRARAGLLFLAP